MKKGGREGGREGGRKEGEGTMYNICTCTYPTVELIPWQPTTITLMSASVGSDWVLHPEHVTPTPLASFVT